jgi:hypothetical protein
MGTAKRREGAVPTVAADGDEEGDDEGGTDAATDAAAAAADDDVLELRGRRVACGSVEVARSRAALARDAGACARPDEFSAGVGGTGVMSSGVCDMGVLLSSTFRVTHQYVQML